MKLVFFSRMLKMCASPHWVIVVAPFVNIHAFPTMFFVKKIKPAWSQVTPTRDQFSLFNTVKPSIATTSHWRPPPKSDHQSKTPNFSQSNHYSWNLSCPILSKAITWCRVWSLRRNVPTILYATQSKQRTFSFNIETTHIVIYSFLK